VARNTSLLTLAVLCALAARAGATPSPTLFRLTVSGTASASWDYTGPAVNRVDCSSSESSRGSRTVRFDSRPTRVRYTVGRIAAVTVRGVKGSLAVFGKNTENLTCAGVETHMPVACVDTTREFRSGHLVLFSPARAKVAVRAPGGMPARSQCPREPREVAPLGPRPTFRVPAALFERERVVRITLTASASQRKVYGDPEAGTLQQRSSWKLTFVRVQP
jgi:hypothetical protein